FLVHASTLLNMGHQLHCKALVARPECASIGQPGDFVYICARGFMTTLENISETVEGLPNFCGQEEQLEAVAAHREPVFLNRTPFRLDRLQSAFGIGLHMHQPLLLEDGDISTAPIISNLKWMMDRQHIHGNHDAPVFAW